MSIPIIPDNVFYQIAKISSQNSTKKLETEIRFNSYFRGNNFGSGVSRETYTRLLNLFSRQAVPLNNITIDYIGGNVRKSTDLTNNREYWITKNQLYRWDNNDYLFRLSISDESQIYPVANFVPSLIRKKERSSFSYNGGGMQLDLTIVNDGDLQNKGSYEVEVEIFNLSNRSTSLQAITLLLIIIQNTNELYTYSEFSRLVNFYNSTLGGKTPEYIFDHRVLYQPRNLHLNDMVFGGLVGNSETKYWITHKTDGLRKILIIHTSGVWLITPPSEAIKVTSILDTRDWIGSILEGELVPPNKRKGIDLNRVKYWYLVFDSLSATITDSRTLGSRSIQERPHPERLLYAQRVANNFKNNLLQVDTKTFLEVPTVSDFYRVMREMFNQRPSLAYQQDGFISMPISMPYNSKNDKLPLSRRKLTKVADICKIKEQENITTDFAIQRNSDGSMDLLIGSGENLIKFVGTEQYPFNSGMVDVNNELLQNLPNGTIVEFALRISDSTDLVVPTTIRIDKTRPNSSEVAIDNWELAHEPITNDTLKGDDITLLRRYHNRIKWSLFGQTLFSKSKGNLLDIGSGRGGDVIKWKANYSKVVAVEPNPEHILEFIRRIKSIYNVDRVQVVKSLGEFIADAPVVVIQTGGENTELISEVVSKTIVKADVVSAMLSLSFFWSSQNLVKKLSQTILNNLKPNGKFVFLTIDGDAVEELFSPTYASGFSLKSINIGKNDEKSTDVSESQIRNKDIEDVTTQQIKLNSFSLIYNDTNKSLYIDIPGTIVKDQTEFLVKISDLRILVSGKYELTEISRADSELFLNDGETLLSSLYSYGVFTPVDVNRQVIPNYNVDLPMTEEEFVTAPLSSSVTTPIVPPETVTQIPPSIVAPTLPPSLTQEIQLPSIPVEQQIPISESVATAPILEVENLIPKLPNSPRTSGIQQIPILEIPNLQTSETPIQQIPILETPETPIQQIPISQTSEIPKLPTSPRTSVACVEETLLSTTTLVQEEILQLPVIPINRTCLTPVQTPISTPSIESNLQASIENITNLLSTTPDIEAVRSTTPNQSIDNKLPSLSVIHDLITDTGLGDDVSQVINCSWYTAKPVVRIAAIGDGSCFFHAVLKSYYKEYANTTSYSKRSQIVQELRRDLAYTLQLPDSEQPDKTFYQTANNGAWVELAHMQIGGVDGAHLLRLEIDYSLEGMQKLFDSYEEVGSEVYAFVAKMLGIDINILLATTSDLNLLASSVVKGIERYNIFISGNGCHYEVIGVIVNGLIETVFDYSDDFVQAYRALQSLNNIKSYKETTDRQLVLSRDLPENVTNQLQDAVKQGADILNKAIVIQNRISKGERILSEIQILEVESERIKNLAVELRNSKN